MLITWNYHPGSPDSYLSQTNDMLSTSWICSSTSNQLFLRIGSSWAPCVSALADPPKSTHKMTYIVIRMN